jgi:hypothetical protein
VRIDRLGGPVLWPREAIGLRPEHLLNGLREGRWRPGRRERGTRARWSQ